MTEEEIAELVREVMADEAAKQERNKHVIPDGGRLYVRRMMQDSLDPVQRSVLFGDHQPLTLDALIQGRDAWRREQAAELAAIMDGTGTASSGAALMKRQEAWERRGEIQSQAWRTARSSAVTDNAGAQSNVPLADAEAAREAAWQKRGERQANAWKRS